jgi:amino acid adenylation domain-containing protein
MSGEGVLLNSMDDGDAADPSDATLDREIAALERRLAERASLEQRLAEKKAEREQLAQSRRVVPVPRDGPLVCTYQQEAVWFEQQLDPSSTRYHLPFVLRLRGRLDVAALARAVRAVVVRHEALRTRIVDQDGRPRQVIDPPPARIPLPVLDLEADQIDGWAGQETHRPLDLATGPLVRTALARVAPDEHVLVVVVHHIVADGWSVGIIASELSELYRAEAGRSQPRLPDLPVQPADHAAWQRTWLRGAELDRKLDYWRHRLSDLPTVDLATDRPRPARPTGSGATLWRRLPDDLAGSCRTFARANQVSLLAVLHATLLTVLHRYTRQTDLPIGSILSGRNRAELEPLVGYFVNTVVLRTPLDGNPTFTNLVRRCHDTILAATDHQDVPFSLIVDTLKPERIPGRNPLFQIGLELQPARTAVAGPALGDVTAEPLEATTGQAHFDVNVVVYEGSDGSADLSVEYATELFDPDRIERLIDHYVTALAHGLARPDDTATDIEIMPAAERHLVVHAWNGTAVEYPAQPLHRMVEAVAAATPDAVAVVDHDGNPYTYRWLDRAANRLAHRLRRHGVGPGTRAGICLPRGADLVTAILAIWKAGGGYVPLEPDLPPDRLAFILGDAAPSIVVTDAESGHRFPTVTALDTREPDLADEPVTTPDGGAGLDDLARLLYTTGSSGAPRGVHVCHRTVHNRIAWMQDTYRLRPDDRVLHATPYGFDASVWELIWPLVAGATAVLAAPGSHSAPRYLHELIISRAVTTARLAPTMLDTFLDVVDSPPPSLRRVFCSGEALRAGTVRRLLTAGPDIDLHNLYGPSAALVDVAAWQCDVDASAVLIGRPIANTRTYVLDSRLRPVAPGIPGELFIAGAGIAGGYHDQPALTARRFVADPHTGRPGARMYATGDLARWRGDGTLEVLGRIDRQVKVRGQRVELGAIEQALIQHPDIRRCAVVLHADGSLVAYLVGHTDDADFDHVRAFLADRLPVYMIPARNVAVSELPVTRSGTLDIARLPEPPPPAPEYRAPRTDTERWLADTWRDLLGIERVGARDDFFALGANSLHITQLAVRIRDHLSVDIPPRDLFSSPSLEQLATRLEATHTTPGEEPIAPVPRDGALACTYQQESLWFVQQLDTTSPVYHIGFGSRLRGELDVAALARALRALAVRHEALRTRFVEQDGLPRQVVDPPPETVPLPVTDLPVDQIEPWTNREIRRPLDLAAGPVFRTALARIGPDDHVLAVTVHHIVSDGWSARILAEELSRLYAAESTGPSTMPLPDLPVQPADHAAWQRRWLTGAELDRRLGYWRDTLADLPTIDFPTDRRRPAHPTGDGATTWRRLPDDLATTARAYGRANRVSFLALLQAALLVVLHRYTGQTDLPIGSVFSGRTRAEIEPVVGFFVNTVVLRTRLDGEPSFADLVRRCHDTVQDASAQQDVPFGLVVDTLQPDRVPGRNPLFQIALSLLPAQAAGVHAGLSDLTAEPVLATTGRAPFDLAINADDTGDGSLYLSVDYSTELFDADRIDRLIEHHLTALAHGLAEPDRRATDLEVMSLAERHQVLHAWNPSPARPVAAAGASSSERGASWPTPP